MTTHRRFPLAIALVGTVLLLPLALQPIRPAMGQGAPQLGATDLADLVVLTEDTPELIDGCDAISIHNIRTGAVVHRGRTFISPGRLTARADLSALVATVSNSCLSRVPGHGYEPCTQPILSMNRGAEDPREWRDGRVDGLDAAFMGGIALLPDGSLLTATSGSPDPYDQLHHVVSRPPYGLVRSGPPFADATGDAHVVPVRRLPLPDLVFEILPVAGRNEAVLALANGTLMTIDTRSLDVRAPTLSFPTAVPAGSTQARFPHQIVPPPALHASLSADGRTVAVNRMFAAEVALVDLQSGQIRRVALPPEVRYAGGVAFNNGWLNSGLLAVHTFDSVTVLEPLPTGGMRAVGRIRIPPPITVWDAWYPLEEAIRDGRVNGPLMSIAWSGSGDRIIAASSDGSAEFAVIDVSDGGSTLSLRRFLTACPEAVPEESNGYALGVPNDIWTANGLLVAPPPPVYLPVALRERCDSRQQRMDVALILDASSSMADPVGGGRTKIAAAVAAARAFLDLLALQPAAPDRDQAAIVTFNADATLRTPLTSDRGALDRVLARITLAQQTRIDRGLAVAHAALTDRARRRPDHRPVLILLTDGRANPVPVEVAVAEADAIKAEGITVFTIGLGTPVDLDIEALTAMASRPSYAFVSPNGEDLEAIYQAIAVTAPCPASASWGNR